MSLAVRSGEGILGRVFKLFGAGIVERSRMVVVFRARAKPGIGKEYEETDARMADLAAKMPGFVSYRQYMSTDGEELAVVEFESHETVAASKAHPEHLEAQRLGRERWFTEYRITVCEVVRDYSFKA
jgi:heme-degrading monooxygenase HmoA